MRRVRGQSWATVGVAVIVFILLAALLLSTGTGAKAGTSSGAQSPSQASNSNGPSQGGFLPIGSRARNNQPTEGSTQVRNIIVASHEDFLHKSFAADCALLSPGGQKFYEGLFQRSTCPAALSFAYAQDMSTPQLRKLSVALLKDEIAVDRRAPVSFHGSKVTLTEHIHGQGNNTITVYSMQATNHAPWWLISGFDSNSVASIGHVGR